MITENTYPEHNDWQKPDGEQPSVSDSSQLPQTAEASLVEEQVTLSEDQPADPAPEVHAEVAPSTPDPNPEQPAYSQELPPVLTPDEALALTHASELLVAEQSTVVEKEVRPLFNLAENHVPLSAEAEAVRPFSEFIEEFRQAEVRLNLNTLVQEQEPGFAALLVENTETSALQEVASEQVQSAEPVRAETGDSPAAEASQTEETPPGLASPLFAVERPVSPLLRPATRLRLPRHSRHRVEEPAPSVEPAKPVEEVKGEESAPPVEVPPSEEPVVRPARRYRFDRPSTAASTSTSLAKAAPAPRAPVAAEVKEPTAPLPEPKPSSEKSYTVAEVPAQKTSAPEAEPASPEVSTPPPAPSERRKRSSHERQREKEPVAPVVPVAEIATPEKEVAPVAEIPVEELPPLEYAELQAASSRRRRRRRVGASSQVAASNGAVAAKAVTPEPVLPAPPVAPVLPPTPPSTLPKSVPAMPVAPPPPPVQNYNIISGYTVSQMNQGNDGAGPFMGPEPSPARGSTFSTTPQVRHTRSEILRSATATTHTVKHTEGQLLSSAAVNHLGNIVSQAIQMQTDRMVAELRRANQAPTNISVSLPPFPSNERVGVFVDVANLLYSARTLRMTVDFGKLLDFLRGNRRLVRAQAYCPTSPQPGDDQMFLQAVKGLGYRITTKNYKTFSSGAKKADLDLDLCMDVVRLVDGKAVDCVVLVSGDSDFMPMLDYCSDHGVRVEVAAFDESMSATLRQSCDLFVNLSMLEEIRL